MRLGVRTRLRGWQRRDPRPKGRGRLEVRGLVLRLLRKGKLLAGDERAARCRRHLPAALRRPKAEREDVGQGKESAQEGALLARQTEGSVLFRGAEGTRDLRAARSGPAACSKSQGGADAEQRQAPPLTLRPRGPRA